MQTDKDRMLEFLENCETVDYTIDGPYLVIQPDKSNLEVSFKFSRAGELSSVTIEE